MSVAHEVYGTEEKKNLANSSFLIKFEFGIKTEGYWDYNWMVLQSEDCADCMQVISPEFNSIHLFDHSSGHVKKRINGLHASEMNISYDGMQSKLRSVSINSLEGIVGPYHNEKMIAM